MKGGKEEQESNACLSDEVRTSIKILQSMRSRRDLNQCTRTISCSARVWCASCKVLGDKIQEMDPPLPVLAARHGRHDEGVPSITLMDPGGPMMNRAVTSLATLPFLTDEDPQPMLPLVLCVVVVVVLLLQLCLLDA